MMGPYPFNAVKVVGKVRICETANVFDHCAVAAAEVALEPDVDRRDLKSAVSNLNSARMVHKRAGRFVQLLINTVSTVGLGAKIGAAKGRAVDGIMDPGVVKTGRRI